MMDIATKGAVLITGTSSGIGKACTLKLDELGFKVFAGVRNLADGEALKQLTAERLIPILIDVTDLQSIQTACETVTNIVGEQGLYALVNNAGMAIGGVVEFISLEDLRQQIEVNVIGQVAMLQTFLPLLRMGKGRIVNISSIAGRISLPFAGAYCASKSALNALTDSLRMELQPWEIPVTLIEPGIIDTPIWAKTLKMGDKSIQQLPPKALELYGTRFEKVKSETQKEASKGIPPEAVAKVVVQALTAKKPKTRYLVGQDAQLRAYLTVLPDRIRDWLITKYFGIH